MKHLSDITNEERVKLVKIITKGNYSESNKGYMNVAGDWTIANYSYQLKGQPVQYGTLNLRYLSSAQIEYLQEKGYSLQV